MAQKTILAILALLVPLAPVATAQPVEPDAVNGAGEALYIRAALPLDEPRHLCVDLPGHGEGVNLAAAFTVHTCKDGMWNLDQRFRWTPDGTGLEMPQYGKCLATGAAGTLVLGECGTEITQWTATKSRLRPASDPSLCITIAEGQSELTPGGKRFQQRYRARDLSLEPCSDAALERQLWSVVQPLDLDAALLPPSGSLPVE